jgi:hypothetical protein
VFEDTILVLQPMGVARAVLDDDSSGQPPAVMDCAPQGVAGALVLTAIV